MQGRRLLAVSAVLVWASTTGAQDAAREGGRLSVVSYNVHGLPSFVTGDDTPGRQRAISPLLEPFDVVGLQEDFTPDGHELLLGAATHPGRVRFAEVLGERFYGSGLTFLARPRVVLSTAEHYRTFHGQLSAGNDGLASKGFQLVRLELAPGVEVDVYNSHLDAGGSPGDQAARADQVAQLTDYMLERSASRAIVFLGDTNLGDRGTDQEVLTRWLDAAGLACACAAARRECCGRIDRVLYRSGGGVELTAETWGVPPDFVDARGVGLSDHEPIRVDLRWRRQPL
jgi:endonuclease/exonuclease/phosphatase family metal-dependent hydrolase